MKVVDLQDPASSVRVDVAATTKPQRQSQRGKVAERLHRVLSDRQRRGDKQRGLGLCSFSLDLEGST